MGEIIFQIIILICCIIGLYFLIKNDEAGMSAFITFFSCLLFTIIILTIIKYKPKERSLSMFNIKTEIRKSVINDSITSIDTVYIIIKKKLK